MRRGADFGGGFFEAHHFLAFHVAAAFGQDLVFKLDRGCARLLVAAHEAFDIGGAAVAVVAIGDQRYGRCGSGDCADAFAHFGCADDADVGNAEMGARNAKARHVHRLSAGAHRDPRGQAVVSAGSDKDAFLKAGSEGHGWFAGCGVDSLFHHKGVTMRKSA